MYHISDCKKYMRCARLYALERGRQHTVYNPYIRMDEEMTSLAAEKLHLKDYWSGHRGDDARLALKAYQQNEWLVKARFEYKGLRIKVPFLHHYNDTADLYFLFVGLYPRDDDMAFYDDMVWVLHGNGIYPQNYYIIHLNKNYVRGDQLDPDKLFVISSSFYNNKNHPVRSVKEAIHSSLRSPLNIMRKMDQIDPEVLPHAVRQSACSRRQLCRYYDQCFPEEANMPDNSILTLSTSLKKYEMLRQGRPALKDADINQIEGNALQYAQMMADRSGGLFVDRMALHAWLENIQYPVSFLDFEWERYAVPPYKGMKPYDVMPFEYSLHIMQKDGSIQHKVFLSIHDDRLKMAEKLVQDIPQSGTVIAYNAEGAEKIRINEFAKLFPSLRKRLLQINNRMEDLQLPFSSGCVYDVRMRGQWSLKAIMNMMNDKSYQDLDIRQGMQAVFEWRHLDRNETDADSKKISDELKEYCGMDSYAMTVILKWLLAIDDGKIKV